MKYSIIATAFTVSSVLAGKGPKDHKSAPTVTVYATETTHKYGRFNKTPHPTTTTVIVSPSEWTSLKEASSKVRNNHRRDEIFTAVKRDNSTAGAAGNSTGGAGAGNSTGGAGAGNSTGGAGAGNSTGGAGGDNNAGMTASGASFAIAGAVAAGCALLM
ncbi:hypothetical protein FOB58_003846 [Candida parapsilosis]|uniref:Uncharacterized protein n=1 Tax=Candida parapsilosis TaxID=5480 RepID=A0A8X7T8X0_CANPA|nr:hypothetical protein FOB60_005301 [Candida parapsilosis]KAF6047768.1 hypothetical protein FOB58_003846 [Candida parapsilosis]KAF6050264.1 hypothetical protein FOB59_002510 [Candida parapsilosis]KAF6061384.1 hypothetical protein FOB61_004141 [Candida parapsilosis]KAI5904213.1 Hydrophilin PGA14 [Candida parapsilosis]